MCMQNYMSFLAQDIVKCWSLDCEKKCQMELQDESGTSVESRSSASTFLSKWDCMDMGGGDLAMQVWQNRDMTDVNKKKNHQQNLIKGFFYDFSFPQKRSN